jgi:hypothetical protein
MTKDLEMKRSDAKDFLTKFEVLQWMSVSSYV